MNTGLVGGIEGVALPGVRVAPGILVIQVEQRIAMRLVRLDQVAAGGGSNMDTVGSVPIGVVGSDNIVGRAVRDIAIKSDSLERVA